MATPLNQVTGMPQMRAAFAGWTSPMVFNRIVQTVQASGFVTSAESIVNVRGVWQPFSAEDIQLKPEGQRSWAWFMLHIEGNSSPFATNDRLEFNGVRYKVMLKKDYSLNNYTQYELIADYQDAI